MTTGELLDSESAVSNTTALIHLQNLSGTGGVDHWFPYSEIEVAFEEPLLDISFLETNLSVDFKEDVLSVVFEDENLSVTIVDDINDISLTC